MTTSENQEPVPRLPTVLIVDDDRVNRAALAEALQSDCRLLLAKDGEGALQRLREEDVSLVLLDISMPGMDGYEVLRLIKSDPQRADLGVIFITGQASEADEERGLLLGAADYITKPVRPTIVRARVNIHLKLAAQRRELERLSREDWLTGLANRRSFEEAFVHATREAAEHGQPIGVALLDVDHFKQFNDRYGHAAGDRALQAVASVLAELTRRTGEIAARYGGEEFVLLKSGPHDFAAFLDDVRARVMGLGILHEASATAEVLTVSLGGVVAQAAGLDTPAALLRRADELLYTSKRDGRNRATVTAYAPAAG